MKNYSRQREEIIKAIKELNNHPTAEEIYMLVKSKDPAVSRSTVYRNLNMLVDNKIIDKISMIAGADRFDYIYDKSIINNYAICVKCGKIFNFSFDFNYTSIEDIINKQTGCDITSNNIVIDVICKECK